MTPRKRRPARRVRTAADVEVVRRELVDPRGVCVKCYAICAPKAVHCEKCQPDRRSE